MGIYGIGKYRGTDGGEAMHVRAEKGNLEEEEEEADEGRGRGII
jgi:hypothetical protein